MEEGRLRRISDHSWQGWLHGYRVDIAVLNGQWHLWLMPRGEWTERYLRCESFAYAVLLAREWIEKHGDKRLRVNG